MNWLLAGSISLVLTIMTPLILLLTGLLKDSQASQIITLTYLSITLSILITSTIKQIEVKA